MEKFIMIKNKLLEITCKEFLMEIVRDSNVINSKLSFFEKILLYDKIREMETKDIISIILNEKNISLKLSSDVEKFKNFEPPDKKISSLAILFFYKKISDPCVRKNIGNKQVQYACKISAIKKVIEQINIEINKCKTLKCKKRLTKELNKWHEKYQDYISKIIKYKK